MCVCLFAGGSMLGSAVCTFFLLLCFSQWAVVFFQCLFFAASAAAWNGIEVVTVELYPASKRYKRSITKRHLWYFKADVPLKTAFENFIKMTFTFWTALPFKRVFNVFESKLLCTPSLHLCNQMFLIQNIHIIKYYYNLNNFFF